MSLQLHLKVIEATDIQKMDLFSNSDPYCVIKVTGMSNVRRTKTKNNTKHPRWNEEFHFPLSNIATDSLYIKMYDKDVVSDDEMATLELPLSTFQVGQVVDQWYDMRPCRKKGGRIHLVVHVAPLGAAPFVNAPMPMNSPMGAFGGAANAMMGMGNAMMGAIPPQPYPMQPQGYGMPPPQPGYGMPPPQPQPGYGMPPPQPGYGMPPQPYQTSYNLPPSGMVSPQMPAQSMYAMPPQQQPPYAPPPTPYGY